MVYNARQQPCSHKDDPPFMNPLNLFRTGAFAAGVVAVGLASAAAAQECENTPTGTRLRIVIDNVRVAKGEMSASLYPGDPSQFLKKNGALKVWYDPTRAPSTTMCIWIPGPGTYAVAVYQDNNNNHRWDHNLFKGIEPFGFSNDPSIGFSQPSFQSSKFHVKADETTIHIKLNYR